MNRRLVNTGRDKLEFQDEPIPEAPSTGVVLKVCYAGICHSDVQFYHLEMYAKIGVHPKVLGHEISGVVHSVGADFAKDPKALSVGDKVLAYSWGGCQQCDHCSAGFYTMCPNKDRNPDSEMYGVWSDGGFQQYLAVVNPWRLIQLPADSDMIVSCLVPCSGITGCHATERCNTAIERALKIKGRANVVCYGAGGLALWMTEIMKAKYGDKVKLCAIDIAEEKLKDIREKGADETLLLQKQGDTNEAVAKIQEKFDGQGVDAAVDFVNVPTSQERIFNSLAPGGVQVCVGLFTNEMAKLNATRIVIRQLTMQGACVGTKEHVQEVLTLLGEGKITGPPITVIQFEEAEAAMTNMAQGGSYRGRYIIEICKP